MSTALALRPALQQQLPPTLSPQIRQAAALLLSEEPTALSYTSVDLRKALYQPISAVAMLVGHNNSLSDPKDLQMMGTALAAVVHRRFPSFRMPEITEALVRGASGEWPLPNGFLAPTLPNFTHWLSCYQQQCRSEALKVLQKVAESQQPQLPAPDFESQLPEAVAQLAEHVVALGTFPAELDPGNLAYEWLKRIGAFNGFKTQAEYAAMMRKESILLTKARAADQSHRHQLNSFAEALRKGWPSDHPLAKSVQNNCKKRLLREWIRYHIARQTDLRTWLTELSQQRLAA
ncbi:hypothetical protein [Hymenobacter sp. YC55]|uniref:hypothetical protein n=1 Tax=Hymenobacter sp. YC55 TaxID=3034019 RepID=UPI0023FA02D5|nr:hypothetical protein [Hymenobacter sp. YC55]MDF7810776.1 hypothetical protein [Hymenobacter sp. YC55]